MIALLKKLTTSAYFQNSITSIILFAGALVGLETYPAFVEQNQTVLHVLDKIVITIFVLEVLLKVGAEGARPWRYFADGWNCFDFLIVAAYFLPFSGQAITVLRLLRLLRVLKLVKALPKLQILVSALLKSIPSMGYVTLLLFLLFYVYAVSAVFLFGLNDPIHFGDLQTAMLSLFRIVTLEDWTDVMYINMYGCDRYGYGADSLAQCLHPSAHPVLGAFFFVSFVLVGTMIILNLFIGVIMTGMEDAQAEAQRDHDAELKAKGKLPSVDDELAEVERQLSELQGALQNVHRRVKDHRRNTLNPSPPSSS